MFYCSLSLLGHVLGKGVEALPWGADGPQHAFTSQLLFSLHCEKSGGIGYAGRLDELDFFLFQLSPHSVNALLFALQELFCSLDDGLFLKSGGHFSDQRLMHALVQLLFQPSLLAGYQSLSVAVHRNQESILSGEKFVAHDAAILQILQPTNGSKPLGLQEDRSNLKEKNLSDPRGAEPFNGSVA
jgi:hypothetical protein